MLFDKLRMATDTGNGFEQTIAVMQTAVCDRHLLRSDAIDQYPLHLDLSVTLYPRLSSGSFNAKSTQQALGLGTRFGKFVHRIGIGNDAATGPETDCRPSAHQRADQDVQVHVAAAV